MKKLLWLLWLLTCIGCGLIGFALARRSRPPDFSRAVVAHVAGEPIVQRELDLQLLLYREQAITELVQLKLCEKEAQRLGISLKVKSEVEPLKRAQAQRERGAALVKAIVLKEAGEAELRRVYETCRAEISLYDCSVMLFQSEDSQDIALDKLSRGYKFPEVARSYSSDQRTLAQDGHVGWITLPELQSRYGPYLSEQAALLPDKRVSRPVASPFGTMVVLVHARKQGFADLRESAEKVLVEARTTALLSRLASKAVLAP